MADGDGIFTKLAHLVMQQKEQIGSEIDGNIAKAEHAVGAAFVQAGLHIEQETAPHQVPKQVTPTAPRAGANSKPIEI